jgi:hypothetical protein
LYGLSPRVGVNEFKQYLTSQPQMINHDNRQPGNNEHSLSQLQDDYEEIGNQVKQIETHIKSLEQ